MITACPSGLVLVCDRDGAVLATHVVGAGPPGLAPPARGAPFSSLFGAAGLVAALDLFTVVARLGAAADRPVPSPRGGTVLLSGVADEGGFVLVVAEEAGAAGRLRAALAAGAPEAAARLAPLAAVPRAPTPPAIADPQTLLDELAAMTSELANAQRALAKSNAELAASNETRNRLMGMLAHDLRTPLQVIAGFAQHLSARLAERIDAGDRACLERIRESSLFMNHLIEDA